MRARNGNENRQSLAAEYREYQEWNDEPSNRKSTVFHDVAVCKSQRSLAIRVSPDCGVSGELIRIFSF
jgi:hypothetical protein